MNKSNNVYFPIRINVKFNPVNFKIEPGDSRFFIRNGFGLA